MTSPVPKLVRSGSGTAARCCKRKKDDEQCPEMPRSSGARELSFFVSRQRREAREAARLQRLAQKAIASLLARVLQSLKYFYTCRLRLAALDPPQRSYEQRATATHALNPLKARRSLRHRKSPRRRQLDGPRPGRRGRTEEATHRVVTVLVLEGQGCLKGTEPARRRGEIAGSLSRSWECDCATLCDCRSQTPSRWNRASPSKAHGQLHLSKRSKMCPTLRGR